MAKQPRVTDTKKKSRRRKSRVKLIRAYAENLPGALLGVFWKEFHELLRGHSGVYILYKHDVPHYVGKASSLASRIRHHQKDRLKRKWDAFSLYVVRGDRQVKDVESLLLRIVKPKGALVSGRFRGAENLKKSLLPKLERYADALAELKRK
jgi:hypothetical protein